GNPLAHQSLSGARGSKKNYAALTSGDMLYEDTKGNALPVPAMESFSEGVSPASYFAGSYGARKAIIGTKLGTAQGGYYAKQMNQVAHRLVVTGDDEEDE